MAATRDGILDIDLRIDVDYDAKDVFRVLARVKPEWKSHDITLKSLGGGFVNRLLLCRNSNDTEYPGVMVRIFGESFSLIHDRQKEKECTALLSKLGLGPKLLCTFKTGLCYEFMNGRTFEWDCDDHKAEYLVDLIIDEMLRWHDPLVQQEAIHAGLDTSMNKPVMYMYKLLQDWPKNFPDLDKDIRFRSRIPTYEALLREVKHIEEIWTRLNMKPVFCHNDINITNLVYKADKGRVIFLDYEWAGFSSVAYDIGYHMASVHTGTAKGDLTNLMPTDAYVREWVSKYLRKKAQNAGSDEMPSEYDVNKLVHEVDVMMPMTMFLVALISIRLGTLPEKDDWLGFDYIGVAAARFDYYFESKKDAKEEQ